MTGRPRTLPDDWVLLQKRDVEGLSGKEIAALYGVTPQAVSKRFKKMHRANPGFLDVLPWRLRPSDKALYAALRLKAHVQERRGEALSPTALRRLRDWRDRLRRDRVVLDYHQDVEVGSPWRYLPREEADNELVIRWPAEAEPPTEAQRELLELPAGQ